MLLTVLFIITIASSSKQRSSHSSSYSKSHSKSHSNPHSKSHSNPHSKSHSKSHSSSNSNKKGNICDDNDDNICDYMLTNSDFSEGTFRIRQSGKYCLNEDIIVNPIPGDINTPNDYGSWFPIDDQAFPGSVTHDDGGWALGFFSAISIEVDNVELDLKAFEISMSKSFYMQQRFFNLIEIQNAPFNMNQGPANFGQTIREIQNIQIKNGSLSTTSHNGIHGFDVKNICIKDINIYDFEVAGLQFNGFRNVEIINVNIGPSATDVPFWGYYSHGRFSLNGFELIEDKENKYVIFNDGRELSLEEIYENLRDSLDIAYRFEMGQSTQDDKDNPLYYMSIEMYRNPFRVPDGGAIYGMLFNSKGLATQGFGDSDNLNKKQGSKLYLENINIDGLFLNVNEIPTLHFDRCEGFYFNEDGTTSITPIFGRFGDTFDVRRALIYSDWSIIDDGEFAYSDIRYNGNPLADAQVALNMFSPSFVSKWGLRSEPDNTRGKQTFIQWATDSGSQYDSLPDCARFICNADCMFHLVKGIIGIRMDGIEQTKFKNVSIKNLYNESPLGSYACDSYLGPFDSGHPAGLEREGFMGSDIRAISIINGGKVKVYDDLIIDNIVSSYGDIIGIHLMDKVKLDIHGDGLSINNLHPGNMVGELFYQQLINDGWVPYPNNIYHCNIKREELKDREYEACPYDCTGNDSECYQLYVQQNVVDDGLINNEKSDKDSLQSITDKDTHIEWILAVVCAAFLILICVCILFQHKNKNGAYKSVEKEHMEGIDDEHNDKNEYYVETDNDINITPVEQIDGEFDGSAIKVNNC